MSTREPRASAGISFQTLTISSIASLTAAILVHQVWQGGAIVGAAVTPVIVGIVSEALRHPVNRLTAVREGGRRLPAERDHDVPPVSRQRGDDPFGLWEEQRPRSTRRRRRWLVLGIVTGVVGFAIAAFALTGSELLFGAAVAGPHKTTIFGGGATRTTTTVTTVTQKTTTPTVTQTVPASPAPHEQAVPTVTHAVPTAPQAAPKTLQPTTTTPAAPPDAGASTTPAP